MRAILAIGVLAGCTNSFELRTARVIAGERPIVGVDADGAGGVWIAYREQDRSDYYALAEVRIVHLGPGGGKLSEWVYRDEYTQVNGLAFAGDAVWLSYNGGGSTGNDVIRKIDPVTGLQIGSFATEPGIIDIDVYGDELRLSSEWTEVIALDLATGGERWRFAPGDGSWQRGIATAGDGKLWIASENSNEILVLDEAHRELGVGVTSELSPDWDGAPGRYLAWDGDRLILAANDRVFWLEPPADL